MEKNPNTDSSDYLEDNGPSGARDSGGKNLPAQRSRNIILSFFILPIIVILIGGAVLLYAFKGEEINSTAIDSRVSAALAGLVGDEFTVSIENTGLSLISSSALTLTGTGVQISKAEDNSEVALLEKVEVGLNLLSVLKGDPKFDRLTVNGGRLDIATIAAQTASAATQRSTTNLNENLKELAQILASVETAFVEGAIRSIKLSEISISSLNLMRREIDEIRLDEGKITLDENNEINLLADLKSTKSNISLSAKWRGNADGGKQLSLGIGGLNTEEWFETAEIFPENTKGIGISSLVRIDGRVPFDATLNPDEPFAKIQTANGKLRLGDNSNTEIQSAVLNIKLSPASGIIQVEPSQVAAGNRVFSLNGELSPEGEVLGLSGPLALQFLASSKFGQLEIEQNASISGVLNIPEKSLSLEEIIVDTQGDKLFGNLEFGFSETSAAVKGELKSPVLSLTNMQAVWPFHIAPKLQEWIAKNVSAGKVEDLVISLDVPKGRFAELPNPTGFSDSEINISSKFTGAQIKTLGELPSIRGANGQLNLNGNRFTATINKGSLTNSKNNVVKVTTGQVEISNIFRRGIPTSLNGQLTGALDSMAMIANNEPLKIAQKAGIEPSELFGRALANLTLKFNAEKLEGANPLEWSAKIKLSKAGSKSPLFGQNVSGANVTIEAEETKVSLKGSAKLDGTNAELDVVEPINGGSPKLRKRNVKLSLTHQALAKLGIDVDPVIKGKLGVVISAGESGANRYQLDLTNAEISLPWISKNKGNKVQASASFLLEQNDGRNTLSDFKFSGKGGRNATGRMVFDKAGLVSANLKNINLSGQEKFNVKVTRKSGNFKIEADGAAFDGRSIIHKVIHEDGFASEKSSTDVSLTANFGRITGFAKQVMENAIVRYETNGGLLTKLVLKGALNGESSSIDAGRTGNSTVFNFDSKDAGASLAMVNIYTKMRGGWLTSKLTRNGDGPFTGRVKLEDFVIVGEERLRSLVAAPVTDRKLSRAAGKIKELDVQQVKFDKLRADITKSTGYLGVKDGRIRNNQIGLTFDGVLYDQDDNMTVRGTFMPLFAISRIIGEIPLIGNILGNGKNSGLIGITYQLKGVANNPSIAVNPISIIAPGIFRRIFQFQE